MHPSSSRRPAVLFDLDGTLIDSIDLILKSARYAFAKHGCEWPEDGDDRWRQGIGRPLRAAFADNVMPAIDTEALVQSYREYQTMHHDRLVSCYDSIFDVVTGLRDRGHPLGVVTSKADALARHGLKHVGLLDTFGTVIGCDTSPRHKPDPTPVLMALEHLGVAAEDTLFVGDSVYDIQAGNAAGVQTVAVLWGPFTREQLERERPDHFAERASDLVGIVDRFVRS
jgi:pyrophosphatase PpaX